MNALIAAAAGAMKDTDSGVESPIFRHKQFERLEAEGEAKKGAAVGRARRVIERGLR